MNYHCGPWWMPQWLKKVLSKRFNAQCGYHDDMYRRQAVGRKMADQIFLIEMKLISSRYRDIVTAYLFYIIARLFGWISWRRNAKK